MKAKQRELIPIREVQVVDPDAVAIGEVYAKAKRATVGAIILFIQCGEMLKAKKKTLPHGRWIPWLDGHQNTLGFEDRKTSARLMKAANVASTRHLNETNAVDISRQIWGNASPGDKAARKAKREWNWPDADQRLRDAVDKEVKAAGEAELKRILYTLRCIISEFGGETK